MLITAGAVAAAAADGGGGGAVVAACACACAVGAGACALVQRSPTPGLGTLSAVTYLFPPWGRLGRFMLSDANRLHLPCC